MSLLDEFYQNESSTNKEILWVFLISLIIGVFFLALFLINIDKHTLLSKIGSIYIIAIFFVLSFFTISMYWFTRKSNHNFLKPIKYIFVLISLFLIAIIFLPMILLGLISNITKFENLRQNLSFYLLSISITLGLNFLIFPVILSGIYDIGNHVFNIYTLTIIATYFIDLILIKLFAFIRYKYQQRRDKKSSHLYKIEKFYSETKKELYVLNYALIFFASLLLYVIKRPISLPEEVFNTLNEGIIYAFALFITYDTLKDKWEDNLSKKRFNEELVFDVISDDLKIVLIQLNNAKYTHNFNSRIVFTYPLSKIDFLLTRYSKNKLCSEVLEEINIIGTNFLDFNEVVMRCEKILLKINTL